MLNEKEALAQLKSKIRVTHQQVVLAKGFMIQNFSPDTSVMIDRLLKSVDVALPPNIILHKSVDTVSMIEKAAEAVSWTLAGCEAIWGLISSNQLIPTNSQLHNLVKFPGWTTVYGRTRWTHWRMAGGHILSRSDSCRYTVFDPRSVHPTHE